MHFNSGRIAPAARIASRADKDPLSLRESWSSKSGGVGDDGVGIATDTSAANPASAAPLLMALVTSAAAADAAADTDVLGGEVAPNPPEAILPKIHAACSCTAASGLDNRETIMGTESAWRSNSFCDEILSGVWELHPAVT